LIVMTKSVRFQSTAARKALGATLAAALLVVSCTAGGIYCIVGLWEALDASSASASKILFLDQAMSNINAMQVYHESRGGGGEVSKRGVRESGVLLLIALDSLYGSGRDNSQAALISSLRASIHDVIYHHDSQFIDSGGLMATQRWLTVWRDAEQAGLQSEIARAARKTLILVSSFLSLAILGVLMVIISGRVAYRDSLAIESAMVKLAQAHGDLEMKVRDRTRALELANAAKGKFLTTMSHELRTPLTSILGYVGLLKNEILPPSAASHLAQIEKAGGGLYNIVLNVLDFSLLDGDGVVLQPRDINLAELLQGLQDEFLEAGFGEFDVSVSDNIPQHIRVDERRLGQVIGSLLKNALAASAGRGVSVTVDKIDESQQIQITISDAGPGLPDEVQASFAQPFPWRAETTFKKRGGLGLGLAISEKLISAMGGKLSFTSSPSGACVSFYIPYETASEFGDHSRAFSGIKVLIVEDNHINRKLLACILRPLHVEIDTAGDGIEAVEKAKAQNFDLIFMDIEMPRMDGIEATVRIRAGEPFNFRTRIVAFSAHALADIKNQCIDAGMDGFLTKPVDAHSVKREVAIASRATHR